MKIKNVKDIVDWRLCVGCGLCAYICPENKIKLINFVEDGIRPMIELDGCGSCPKCVEVCPGFRTVHNFDQKPLKVITELSEGWGSVLELWEGYSAKSDLRYSGSSAGLASAIALYCIENEDMSGVLHIGSDPENPLMNKTYLSQSYYEILTKTGSRYAPASPCDSLEKIENAKNKCVFIGKPCDIAGLRNAQDINPNLDEKVGVAISIFCAGTPSTKATLDLLKTRNIDPAQVSEIRYRGKGWPGMFSVKLNGNQTTTIDISYKKSWGFLQAYRPFRCHLCPDGTGEFADISCGDPWYREINNEEAGSSLVLVRTEKGRNIIRNAMESGYIILNEVDYTVLIKSQENLLLKRKSIWGRLFALKIFRIPTPQYRGFHLFTNWIKASNMEKIKSVLGTVKRILIRNYLKRKKYI